jgi:hypothetical protein
MTLELDGKPMGFLQVDGILIPQPLFQFRII